jgi:diguanylate cyclase (GGDEF)-like protein
VGDTVIKEIGDALSELLPDLQSSVSGAAVYGARWGGDEFTVISVGNPESKLLDFAKQIKEAVTKLCDNSSEEYFERPITISQGISYFESAAASSIEDCHKEAEKERSNAKKEKNCISWKGVIY